MRIELEVKKDAKGKPCEPCKYYPDKMIGSEKCRGCTFHRKHDQKFTKIVCSCTDMEEAAVPARGEEG